MFREPKFGINDDEDEEQLSMEIIGDSQEDASSDNKLVRIQDYSLLD